MALVLPWIGGNQYKFGVVGGVNLDVAANKDIPRRLVAALRVLSVLVAVVVVAGGRKKTQSAPLALTRKQPDSFERRFRDDRKTQALVSMDCRAIQSVDDGSTHRTCRLRSSEGLPQFAPQNLARLRPRNCLQKVNLTRLFVVGKAVGDEAA